MNTVSPRSRRPRTDRHFSTGLLLMLLSVVFAVSDAQAHSLNDSYLDLTVVDASVDGRLKVGIADLEIAVGLDDNGDGTVTWGEIRQAGERIDAYWQAGLRLHNGERSCVIDGGAYRVEQLAGGPYLVIPLQGSCDPSAGALALHYDLFFDDDRSHRGIVAIDRDGTLSSHVMAPQRRSLVLEADAAGFMPTLTEFVGEGVWHIWIGIDHILFLVAMLLGVVLHQRRGGQSAAGIWRASGMETVKLVTAFTLAHSITLVLASTGQVSLPPRLVESAIALSVVVSGINILVPIFGRRHWKIAFAFGLVHGFGFANVLSDLDMPVSQFAVSLLGFNLGVETGQLAIVLVAVPLLVVLTGKPRVRRISSLVSGLAIAQVGLLWLVERGF